MSSSNSIPVYGHHPDHVAEQLRSSSPVSPRSPEPLRRYRNLPPEVDMSRSECHRVHRHQQRPRGDRPQRESKPIIYSICIPRVFKNITEKRIRAIMYSLKFGFVERVDMVTKKNEKGEEFSRVFVHFSSWNEHSKSAMQVKAKLDADLQVKIVYDSPWYWMISKSKTQRPEQRRTRPAPFIDFDHAAVEPTSPSVPPPQQEQHVVPHSPPVPPPQ